MYFSSFKKMHFKYIMKKVLLNIRLLNTMLKIFVLLKYKN